MKVALVTGGSGGIGKAICLHLGKSGHHVLVHYNNNVKAANETVSEISETGGSADTIRFDVSNLDEVKTSLENWKSSNTDKYISVLVNNAGVSKDNLMVWME